MEVSFDSGPILVTVRISEDTIIDLARDIAKDEGIDVSGWSEDIIG